MHTARELRELLAIHQLRLSKRLGQHYLVDPAMTRRLVAACEIGRDETVVEIGAGLGALTDLLAERAARVVAIEVDRGICALLKARMAAFPNVEVRCQDILEFPWRDYPGCLVVGAIPYHITSPILVALCEQATRVRRAWLAMQREVAERLCAKPRTKHYGRLTLLAQYHFEVASLLRIPRGVFFPRPAVDSTWIRLAASPRPPVQVRDERLLFALIREAFAQRRKMLVNGLMRLDGLQLDRAAARDVLRRIGCSERIRGEELSLEAFAALADRLADAPSVRASVGKRKGG